MIIKKIFISLIITFIFFNLTKSDEIKIISKVGNEIITNIDIENEKNYLLLLNKNLNKISKKEIFYLAKNSLIREKIKKKEINNLFIKEFDTKLINKIIENFYKRLGFTNKVDFIKVLDEKNLILENLEKKILLEAKWNQLIYIKFNKNIKIDEKKIQKKIRDDYNNQKKNI